jgi:gamma-glutamyl-gamma-aminobutyrate hydrolase PuuD
MGSMPLIGLTTYAESASWGPFRDVSVSLAQDAYHSLVAAAGARPLLIPQIAGDPEAGAAEVVEVLDGLVIIGGLDVTPSLYGADLDASTGRTDLDRDRSDLALITAALDADLPLLCICRGHQVLNVAFGGTLHQHVPDVVGHIEHQPATGSFTHREVECTDGTLTASIFGKRPVVACSHHQAIDQLGDGLVVTARSVEAEGTPSVIEAVERPDARFLVSVQWHPEERRDQRPFDALVAATRA